MKLTMKLFLLVALFTATVSAGDMGSGGYTQCTENCPPPCPTGETCRSVPTEAPTIKFSEGVILISKFIISVLG